MADRRDVPPVELANVEAWRNERVPEEFPEGPYGAPERPDGFSAAGRPADSDSTGTGPADVDADVRPEQRPHSPFGYADRTFHEGMGRAYPGEDRQPSVDERPET